MNIIPYTKHDVEQVASLYHTTVHAISPEYYSLEQLEAWAPTPPDIDFWNERLAYTTPFLFWVEDRVAGFIELEDGGYIDCLYTHPEYQRLGIATALYQHVKNLAIERGHETLTVDASKVAREFFVGLGFIVVNENKVERKGQKLTNFRMTKQLK